MTTKAELKEAVKTAMKNKDKIRVETLRSFLSAIQYEEMQKGVDELGNEQIQNVLQSERKKLAESLEYAEKSERAEAIKECQVKLAIVEELLPKQLSRDELVSFVQKLKAEQPDAQIPQAMQRLKAEFPGQFDGKTASQVAKEVLSSS